MNIGLTHRDVLQLSAEGYTAKEIARVLGLSPYQVTRRLRTAYKRLGALNKAHACALAWSKGWIH